MSPAARQVPRSAVSDEDGGVAAGSCPGCGQSGPPVIVLRTQPLPVLSNVLWACQEDAVATPRASLTLVRCPACGLIRNDAFEPDLIEYGPAYENALDHSPVFRGYAATLAAELVTRHELAGRLVVDLGCGQGGFLRQLVDAGAGRGLGFDPSFDSGRAGPLPDEITIVASELDPSRLDDEAAIVCCRHVLEHVPEPAAFLRELHAAMACRRNGRVFFEVPAGEWVLSRRGVWDLIYEHVGYFTGFSLAAVFGCAGFEPTRVRRVYGGQYLTIEARVSTPRPVDPGIGRAVAAWSTATARQHAAEVRSWSAALDRLAEAEARCVIWGAGSKGVTFLNTLDRDRRRVLAAVDLNPTKHGRFVSGTGHPIVAPADLRALRPTSVIVMNALYRDEIARRLADESIDALLLAV